VVRLNLIQPDMNIQNETHLSLITNDSFFQTSLYLQVSVWFFACR